MTACAYAGAQTTIDFNEVTTQSVAQIPNGFAGFDWMNFYAASPSLLGYPYNASGYQNGLICGQYVGVNGYANPSELLTPGGSDAISDLRGYFTAAWTSDDQLTIEGLVNGNVVQSFDYGLSETQPQLLRVQFSQGVSAVEFTTFSPTTYSSQMVVDELTLNPNSTPEPASLAALGLGITGLVRLHRRRLIEVL